MINKSPKKNIAVLISGRGSNLQAIINAEKSGTIGAAVVRVVVSNVADALGLARAGKHDIEALFVDPDSHGTRKGYDLAIAALLKDRKIDLVCLAGYLRVLSPEFVEAFKGKIMNIHPALLPAFPGLNVQEKAIKYGVKFSGCTVHFVDDGVDTGPIIAQSVVRVRDDDTVETLSKKILIEEHTIYPLAIKAFVEGRMRIEGRRVVILPDKARSRRRDRATKLFQRFS